MGHLPEVNLGELWVLYQNILTVVEEIRVLDRLGSVADAAESDRFEPLALRSVNPASADNVGSACADVQRCLVSSIKRGSSGGRISI